MRGLHTLILLASSLVPALVGGAPTRRVLDNSAVVDVNGLESFSHRKAPTLFLTSRLQQDAASSANQALAVRSASSLLGKGSLSGQPSAAVSADVIANVRDTAVLLASLDPSTSTPLKAIVGLNAQLLGCHSAGALATVVASVNADVKALLGASVSLSADAIAKLQVLAHVVASLQASLKGDVVVGLDAAISACGGTVAKLLAALGISLGGSGGGSSLPVGTPSASATVAPSVAVTAHPTSTATLALPPVGAPPASTAGPTPAAACNCSTDPALQAQLQGILSLLLNLGSGAAAAPAGVSLQGLLGLTANLLSSTSADGLLHVVADIDAQIKVLLGASVSGDLLVDLKALLQLVVGLQASLNGSGALDLNADLAALGGTVGGLLASLGVDVGLGGNGNVTTPSHSNGAPLISLGLNLGGSGDPSPSTPTSPTHVNGSVPLNADVAADLNVVLGLLVTLGSGAVKVPAGISLDAVAGLASQLLVCSSASSVSSLLAALEVKVNGLLDSVGGCACKLESVLSSLASATPALQGALGGAGSSSLDGAIHAAGGTVGQLVAASGLDGSGGSAGSAGSAGAATSAGKSGTGGLAIHVGL